MKKIAMILVALAALNCNAGTLDDLKAVPASKYELGKFQLELFAYIMTEKLKGKPISNYNFIFEELTVEEQAGKILLVSRMVGRAKEISNEICSSMNEGVMSNPLFVNLHKKIWPGLTEKQYEALSSEFVISTELISKENSSFTIKC